MSCDRGHQVKEIKDNFRASIRLNTDWYKGCKRIASHVRVWSPSQHDPQIVVELANLVPQSEKVHTPPRSRHPQRAYPSTTSWHYKGPVIVSGGENMWI